MPNYDKRCNVCGHVDYDVLEPLNEPKHYCTTRKTTMCAGDMERVWLQGKSHHIVGDEIDVWINNMLCHDDGSPRHFTSQKELNRVAEEKGALNYVVHQPTKSGDKNPHTVRWDTLSPVKEEDRLRRWHEHEAELQHS